MKKAYVCTKHKRKEKNYLLRNLLHKFVLVLLDSRTNNFKSRGLILWQQAFHLCPKGMKMMNKLCILFLNLFVCKVLYEKEQAQIFAEGCEEDNITHSICIKCQYKS